MISRQSLHQISTRLISNRFHYQLSHIPSAVLRRSYSDGNQPLYDGHYVTTPIQKMLLFAGSGIISLFSPARDDMIAVLGETSGQFALTQMRQKMLGDPEGHQILIDRPTIHSSTLDFEYLRSLPEGTLAHAYLRFLDDNKVTPDSRKPVHFVDDAELAYIMQRYRETHDLVHALLGMPTNLLGEVTVKWVEAFQTGLPMCYLGAVLAPVRFRPKQRLKYTSTYLPWAIQCGTQSEFLMNLYYEKHWTDSVTDLRKRFKIPDPPQ